MRFRVASTAAVEAGVDSRHLAAACREVRDGIPKWLEQELRSNHAGETGAVSIYQGARFVCKWLTRDQTSPEALRRKAFLEEHQASEQRHLDMLEAMQVPRSVFTPLWRIAGWAVGIFPSLVSPRAFYFTTVAVEEFVELHYGEQITRLANEHAGEYEAVLEILKECCEDEVHHRNEAASLFIHGHADLPPERVIVPATGMFKSWKGLVTFGSRTAADIARHI